MNTAYRAGRGIEAGRVSGGTAFSGYKQSGIGRETHKMMLDHYQETKNLLVSYSPNKLGFFSSSCDSGLRRGGQPSRRFSIQHRRTSRLCQFSPCRNWPIPPRDPVV